MDLSHSFYNMVTSPTNIQTEGGHKNLMKYKIDWSILATYEEVRSWAETGRRHGISPWLAKKHVLEARKRRKEANARI